MTTYTIEQVPQNNAYEMAFEVRRNGAAMATFTRRANAEAWIKMQEEEEDTKGNLETCIEIKTFVDRGIRRFAVMRDGEALAYFFSRDEAEGLAHLEQKIAEFKAWEATRGLDVTAKSLDAALDKNGAETFPGSRVRTELEEMQ